MYHTWLTPYLENALDAEQRRTLEARLAEDPALAAELESLRRAEPRLRQMAASLRRAEPVAAPGTSAWPRLREQIGTRPARPRPAPVFWWAGGLCAASALTLAVVALHPTAAPSHAPVRIAEVSIRDGSEAAVRPDEAAGTVTANGLRLRAVQVARARKAGRTRPVADPTRKLPGAAGLVASGKHPSPAMMPFPVEVPPDVTPPAPTHTPSHAVKAHPRRPMLMAQAEPGDDISAPNPPEMGAAPPAAPPAANRLAIAGPGTAPPNLTNPADHVAAGGAGRAAAAAVNSAPVEAGVTGGGAAGPSVVIIPTPRPAFNRAILSVNGNLSNGNAFANAGPLTLRQRLERTVTPPLYGTAEGEQQEQHLLQDAQQAGELDRLTTELEHGAITANQAASQEAVAARLRAAIYEMTGDLDRALLERRDVVLLSSATGEDWFELAQTEARAGNADSAGKAYARALRATSPPLSAAHRAVARQHAP